MVDGLTLRVFSHDRTELLADLSGMAQGYRQEVTEGPYRASFDIAAGEQGADAAQFADWQNLFLGCYLEARHNGLVCWGGYVREIRHTTKEYASVLSIRDLANQIKALYTDEYSDQDRYTDWMTDYRSVARFGRMEGVLQYEGKVTAQLADDGSIKLLDESDPSSRYTEVHGALDEELARMAWPQLSDLSFSTKLTASDAADSLEIEADGMTVLADSKLVSDGLIASLGEGALRDAGYAYPDGFIVGSETTVGEEIQRLVDVSAFSGWLHAVKIEANDTVTSAGVDRPMGLWTRILQLAKLRNQAGDLYRLSVDATGGVVYERMTMDQDYLWLPGNGIVRMDGERPTWTARPGIVQLAGGGLSVPGTHMPSADLVYMERVTMAEGYDYAALSLRNETPEDTRRDYAANLRRLEKQRKAING